MCIGILGVILQQHVHSYELEFSEESLIDTAEDILKFLQIAPLPSPVCFHLQVGVSAYSVVS